MWPISTKTVTTLKLIFFSLLHHLVAASFPFSKLFLVFLYLTCNRSYRIFNPTVHINCYLRKMRLKFSPIIIYILLSNGYFCWTDLAKILHLCSCDHCKCTGQLWFRYLKYQKVYKVSQFSKTKSIKQNFFCATKFQIPIEVQALPSAMESNVRIL